MCRTNVDMSTRVPPEAIDERCFPEFHTTPVTEACSGSYTDATFFDAKLKYGTTDFTFEYPYRHKTLFNLYAMD